MAEQSDPSRGPLAAEVESLVALAGQWARSALPEHEMATGAPECVRCPLCRLVRALRDDSSQLTESVSKGVEGAVTAIEAVLMLLRPLVHTEPTVGSAE
jgi:hypothetical protein